MQCAIPSTLHSTMYSGFTVPCAVDSACRVNISVNKMESVLRGCIEVVTTRIYSSNFKLKTWESFCLFVLMHTVKSTMYTVRTLKHVHCTYTQTCTLYVHSNMYTVHSTIYTVHSTMSTVHSTMYTVHSTIYTVHSTMSTVHCTLNYVHVVHSTMYSAHSTIYTVHCAFNHVQYALCSVKRVNHVHLHCTFKHFHCGFPYKKLFFYMQQFLNV